MQCRQLRITKVLKHLKAKTFKIQEHVLPLNGIIRGKSYSNRIE